MEKQNYSMWDRTSAQTKAMELKGKGYQVTRIVDNTFDDKSNNTIAFGYNPTPTSDIKKDVKVVQANHAEVTDFEFVYWN